ncbi:MAG: type II toxin-antitoxin system VapB family antitoxin [Geminicoccaceae bacterium]
MRTNIDIDDALLEEAQRLAATPTKKATVALALETLIRCLREREALKMFGKLQWEGDLDASREGRTAA